MLASATQPDWWTATVWYWFGQLPSPVTPHRLHVPPLVGAVAPRENLAGEVNATHFNDYIWE